MLRERLNGTLRITGTSVLTVQEAGWSGKQNGELLSLAEAAFDVLIPVHTNLRYQQNLTSRRIAILILRSSSNRLEHIRQHFPACVAALEKIKAGEIVQVASTGGFAQ